jgi:hypothetical protein
MARPDQTTDTGVAVAAESLTTTWSLAAPRAAVVTGTVNA